MLFRSIADGPCDKLPAGPCGVRAWEQNGKAEAIPGTLKLFNAAKTAGVAVFFITGRSEASRMGTETNLRFVGYAGWTGLVMRPAGSSTKSAADYKAPERHKIEEQGFTIIANIGDQPSDLAGGFAAKSFLVPNPFYRIP